MLAAIRIRGRTGIRKDIEDTARILNLTRINHMVIVSEEKQTLGMLRKVKDYVTWGEIDDETLKLLLEHRLLLKGRKKPSSDDLKASTGYKTYATLSKAILSGKTRMKDMENVVPIFRLHPPKGGYEGVRKQFQQNGSGGYRGNEINILIRKMIKPGEDLNGKSKN